MADVILDNRGELVQRFGGIRDLCSHPDGEILYESFCSHPEETLAVARGAYACAYLEPGKRTLTLFNDAVGNRSVYYFQEEKRVYFSTLLAGITCATTQAEIVRAAEEGAAFALMDNITEARASGAQLRTLRAVGGSVNSRIWMQIKASVAGMPIEIPASCHGAPGGMLAVLSCAEGEFASIREAAANLVRIRETVDPVAAWIPVYQEKFELFRSTYRHLKPDFPSFHQAGGN